MILKLKTKLRSEDIAEIENKLAEKFREKVILVPDGLELISNIYEIKDEDIRITDAELKTESIFCGLGMVDYILKGIEVKLEYKDINASLFIESNKLLNVKDMKREIINRFSIKEINVKEDM